MPDVGPLDHSGFDRDIFRPHRAVPQMSQPFLHKEWLRKVLDFSTQSVSQCKGPIHADEILE